MSLEFNKLATLCKRQFSPSVVAAQGLINPAEAWPLHCFLPCPFCCLCNRAADVLRGLKINCMKKNSEKIYVPYHVNPAVIKGYLSRLPKDQLILHGRYIRMRAWHAEPGSNKCAMFIRLYQYCRQLYIQKFR